MLWAATMSCNITYCCNENISIHEKGEKFNTMQDEDKRLMMFRSWQQKHCTVLTFLMVYREMAMDMTDMKTMAAA